MAPAVGWPSLGAMLSLDATAYGQMVAHAYDGLPDEACGLFAAAPGTTRIERFYPCRNDAASSRVYTINPLDYMKAERDADGSGLEIVGVMHSHTHTEAYPSPTDVAQAVDPGWHYIIVSLRQEAPVLRSYTMRDGEIHEEPVGVVGR